MRLICSLLLSVLLATPVAAADLLAKATGNLTAAGTWVVVDTGTNAKLVSTNTSTTALTTGNLDSATFTPTATPIQYWAIRLASRATGTPTNTLTSTLRDSTTATDAATCTVNVSDLPVANTTDDQGGWIGFVAAASITPNGTDAYVLRSSLSATTTAVSLSTNGTANNWQRLIGRTATAAPAAGDDMHVMALFNCSSNPATRVPITVTMDSTAATDYGSNVPGAPGYRNGSGINISSGGTVQYPTTGSTNSYLRLSGVVVVYSGGTFTAGTPSTPIPSTSTAIFELDPAASTDFMPRVMAGGTWQMAGVPRTAGKLVSQTLLTATAASGATVLNVADDTGWKSGDAIAVTQGVESAGTIFYTTLSADAGASSLSLAAGLNATRTINTADRIDVEVVNYTRNVTIRTNTAFGFRIDVMNGATFSLDWVRIDDPGVFAQESLVYAGANNGGSFSLNHVVFYLPYRPLNVNSGNTAVTVPVSLTNVTAIGMADATLGSARMWISANETGNPITVDGLWLLYGSTNGAALSVAGFNASFQNFRVFGPSQGVSFSAISTLPKTFTGWKLHADGLGSLITVAMSNKTFDSITIWNSAPGMNLGNNSGVYNIAITNGIFVGNSGASDSQGIFFNGTASNVLIRDCVFAGTTTLGQRRGLLFNADVSYVRIENSTFGVAAGINVAHVTADVDLTGGLRYPVQFTANRVSLASATKVRGFSSANPVSWIGYERLDGTAANHRTDTIAGTLAYSSTTCDATPCAKLTPSSTTQKLDTAAGRAFRGFLVAVTSGQAPTISVKVLKDATYTGAAPRLVLKANPALGVNADTVLATFAGAAGSYQVLSGTAPAATDDGVFEAVVDCDGTAGFILVDSWGVVGASAFAGDAKYWAMGGALDGLKQGTPAGSSLTYWADGHPSTFGAFVGAGGPTTGGFSPFLVAAGVARPDDTIGRPPD